ncbi:hypothetical protein SEA_BIBWIT_38 [Gordonia phage Bibwit]|uniref:Minor tail protein n=2 Tax=Vividuovirus TaxID=2560251 RepID=A0A3G3M821_9CAUD|nr:hypothetical protein KNU17_gp36 [Gordonia phage Ailee]YP_010099198.1 hypothetical protein KNU18_gp38 [Gordonia phage Bibwit]AYR02506.1 hypothetical protein SEA_AILEE_36 [Gordonia phage Ailee]AYR02591.1 hypothetical protein SEA_BIBWIT_38 [Gordonia phage Bibwit]
MGTHSKHPADVRDLQFDFGAFLARIGGSAISEATFSSTPAGLTLSGDDHTLSTATVRVGGGVLGMDYRVTCHATTTGGQVVNRSATVQVRAL